MAKRERESFSPPAIGGSSLLVVFGVLCLTVFALLSLSTVRADLRLAGTSRRAVTDYYAADNQAQEILARLREGESVDGVSSLSTEVADGSWSEVYSYAVPISDVRELQVEVRIDWNEPGKYEILRYQVVNTGDWSADDGLEIWDGDPF